MKNVWFHFLLEIMKIYLWRHLIYFVMHTPHSKWFPSACIKHIFFLFSGLSVRFKVWHSFCGLLRWKLISGEIPLSLEQSRETTCLLPVPPPAHFFAYPPPPHSSRLSLARRRVKTRVGFRELGLMGFSLKDFKDITVTTCFQDASSSSSSIYIFWSTITTTNHRRIHIPKKKEKKII